MTHLQMAVLKYVTDYVNKHTVSPTYREIFLDCNLSSRNHAHVIVTRLCKLGYLAKGDKQEHRSILPVRQWHAAKDE